MDLDEKFGSNLRAEIEGVWAELGEDAAVKVARIANPEAARAWKKMPRAVKLAIDEGTAHDGPALQFFCKYLAENILRDWRGLSQKGKPLPPYDSTIGASILKQKRRFRERVFELACDEDLFNVEAEEDAKNLPELSDGSSNIQKMPSKPSAVGS